MDLIYVVCFYNCIWLCVFFFFKQKTAYEMRISDWSSDVCSSDLNSAVFFVLKGKGHDEHDTVKLPWEAGDACIVENGCVHQHFNDDPKNDAVVLIDRKSVV